MLPRRHRLTGRAYAKVKALGRRQTGRYLSVQTYRRATGPTQIGVAMSVKAHKRATVRNRHKRFIREIVRQLLPELPTGMLVAITVRKSAETPADWQALEEELRRLLKLQLSG